MEKIVSFNELERKIRNSGKSFLFFYKNDSEQSRCALNNLMQAFHDNAGNTLYLVDVKEVADIHGHFAVTSVPSLVLIENGRSLGIVKGCHDPVYYESLAKGLALSRSSAPAGEKPVKRVTVYSTPTCSWCNTLKTWLNKNNIRFTDIDISVDHSSAVALVRRSGQQGVPQTDINGRIVVGFDQVQLKKLLEIG
jgi:glutaredoxin-like YruB-family protein